MSLKLVPALGKSGIFLGILFSFLYSFHSKAACCSSVCSGNWANTTWSCGAPGCGDTLIIQAGYTVTINTMQDYTSCSSPMCVIIYGTLVFVTGNKLRLPCGSSVQVMSGGSVQPGSGGGSSNYIEICGSVVWTASSGPVYGPSCLGCAVLASRFVSFSAAYNSNSVELEWTTATESNVDYFEVERSSNAKDFITVAARKSKAENGNSESEISYNAYDLSPASSGNYYRVKEVSDNNLFSYSSIIYIERTPAEKFMIFPNPNNGVFSLQVGNLRFRGEVQLEITNATGISVLNSSIAVDEQSPGEVLINFHDKLSAGIYFCRVTVGDKKLQTKMIIQ